MNSKVGVKLHKSWYSNLIKENTQLKSLITELKYHCEVYKLGLRSIQKVLKLQNFNNDSPVAINKASFVKTCSRRSLFEQNLVLLSQRQALDKINRVVLKAKTFIHGYSLLKKPTPPEFNKCIKRSNSTPGLSSSTQKNINGKQLESNLNNSNASCEGENENGSETNHSENFAISRELVTKTSKKLSTHCETKTPNAFSKDTKLSNSKERDPQVLQRNQKNYKYYPKQNLQSREWETWGKEQQYCCSTSKNKQNIACSEIDKLANQRESNIRFQPPREQKISNFKEPCLGKPCPKKLCTRFINGNQNPCDTIPSTITSSSNSKRNDSGFYYSQQYNQSDLHNDNRDRSPNKGKRYSMYSAPEQIGYERGFKAIGNSPVAFYGLGSYHHNRIPILQHPMYPNPAIPYQGKVQRVNVYSGTGNEQNHYDVKGNHKTDLNHSQNQPMQDKDFGYKWSRIIPTQPKLNPSASPLSASSAPANIKAVLGEYPYPARKMRIQSEPSSIFISNEIGKNREDISRSESSLTGIIHQGTSSNLEYLEDPRLKKKKVQQTSQPQPM